MNNMLLRAISGAVYVAIIVICILAGPRWFTLLAGVFGVIGINEVVRMACGDRRRSVVAEYLDLGFFALMILLTYFCTRFDNETIKYLIGLGFLYIPMRMFVAVQNSGDGSLRQAVSALFALVYVGVPLALINYCFSAAYLVSAYKAVSVLLFTFVLIWLNDTGAYLSGRAFGNRKLCERLSPKKTWEGFWGGFLLCVIAGVVFALCSDANVIVLGFYGALVSIASTYGDLFESLIKRRCGVKDSGTLIPGHGGVLDRIDSFLAVAPLAALMLYLF